jgi:uncharacterized membrane protein YadS
MIFISSTKLAGSLNHGADARFPSTIQRWSRRNSREILPDLFLNSVIAGAAFAIKLLPGMAMFSPTILSMVIGIAFHNIAGTAAWAKQGVTFSLRRLKGFRPALPGALAFLLIAGFSLTLIKLME